MRVTRGAHTFELHDNDLSGDWGFWDRFASGTWEPEILDRIPELIDGGTYLDIGSWIGPQLLIASTCADRCIGFEPDPTAFAVLRRNVAPLTNVEIHQAGISDVTGYTTITTAGDSMSRIGEGDHVVPAFTVADAVDSYRIRDVRLVKIDIEGHEQHVFPEASDTLRSFNCPVFLSIHPWITKDPLEGCKGWRVEVLADHEALLWPV